jgi:pimeloyl-ACP methyl ester carboxylesterase
MTSQPSPIARPERKAEEVSFDVGDYRLAGTLLLPSEAGPHPAVALLHGAGPGVRNDYVAPIADAFHQAGLAVLAWDRPGCGNSTGDWQRQTMYERAEEALTAVWFLQQHTDIDPQRIGLWGQSQGGNVACIAAGLSGEVAFIVATSPAGITLAEIQVTGLERQMRIDGVVQEQIEAAVRCAQALQAASRRGDSYTELDAKVICEARTQPWWQYFVMLPDAETWDYWRTRGGIPDLDFDPVPVWERVHCSGLAIWGERDTVLPMPEVVARTEVALARAGNPDVTIQVFPGAKHGIELVETGELAPGYLELIASWTRERVGLS